MLLLCIALRVLYNLFDSAAIDTRHLQESRVQRTTCSAVLTREATAPLDAVTDSVAVPGGTLVRRGEALAIP